MNAILELISKLESANQSLFDEANGLNEEINRLTKMIPKVVIPKNTFIASRPAYMCDCGTLVGIRDKKNNYCWECGAKLDWEKAESHEDYDKRMYAETER